MRTLLWICCIALCSSCSAQQAALQKNTDGSITVYDNGNVTDAITISPDGKLALGQPNPKDKLEVNGQIHAKAVEVDLNHWPDYVFDKDYNLIDLKSLKAYIKANGHLPDVPAATTVLEEGINLGEMDAILLQKIEELTLHLIEKDQQLDVLSAQLTVLQEEVQQLKHKN